MTTTAIDRSPSGPPFPLGRCTSAPWKEQALARIAGQRFLFAWIAAQPGPGGLPASASRTLEDHWTAAAAAAKAGWFPRRASVARVASHLDEVDTNLLRIAPLSYLSGQLPGLLANVRQHLLPEDPRRRALEQLADRRTLGEEDRETVVAAYHAACLETRRAIARVRSFRNLLLATALALTIAAAGLAVFGALAPAELPLCFTPNDYVVCPTSTTHSPSAGGGAERKDRLDALMRREASGWDIALIELVGLVAAGLAAALSLRRIEGTSTPYSLPVASSVLKLPTGALTAVLGLVLMRGNFVPGLSALDTSAQILAWAALFGYSQQILTRLVDDQAQQVLSNVAHRKQAAGARAGAPEALGAGRESIAPA